MKVKIGKVIFVVAPLLLSRTPLQGQDKLPKGELFGGYSYQRASISGGPFVERGNSNGWGVGLTGNFGKNFGATANFTGTYGSVRFYTGSTGFRLYQFLCGPRISLRTPRFTVFGHALAGAMRTNSSKILFPSAILPGISDTRFAMSLGGGADINTNRRVAIRVAQLDYIPVRTRPAWTHDIRVLTGVVFRFGS